VAKILIIKMLLLKSLESTGCKVIIKG